MRILVTGAAGFIGSHVTERLLKRGDSVLGLDSFDAFYARPLKERNLARALSQSHFRFEEADIRDGEAIQQLFAAFRPEAVIHLAAKAGVRPSITHPEAYVETNVSGTLHLLQACAEYPVRHFVFASSSSVYGDVERVPFRETDSTNQPASPYAATKKAGEMLCYTYHQLLQMPVTCLRFFTVFGPRQRPDLAINKFVRLIDSGQPIPFFGDGTTRRDYTYVADTVEGILAALDRPDNYQIYNLGRSHPVTLRDLVAAIEKAIGKPALLDQQPEQPGDVRVTYADVSRARERLGYQPRISLEEGIARFIAWWRENQDLL